MRIALAAALTALSISAGVKAQPSPELRLPQATAPAPRVIPEQGESPLHYRLSPRIVLPLVRIGAGYHGRLPINGFEGGSAFSFDLHGGAVFRFGRGARAGLLTEAGYSYVTFSEHLASLGIGVVYGLGTAASSRDLDIPSERSSFKIALVPHAIAGHAYEGGAVGARTSVIVGYSFYALELSHQFLRAEPGQAHEIHIMLTSLSAFGEDE
ncbi:MAG: hypothetical protein HUU21_13735 [Polyangiaceae bacterium]|nr:hypothetical protein [Polyangiaceae bacterium]NUQ74611.1 hypothetical protein [Polyangiaceae bacterium]